MTASTPSNKEAGSRAQGSSWHRFANPNRFLRLSRAIQPWVLAITLPCLAAGLYFALIASPIDYQQKDTVRIMYVHVPAAWMAMFGYSTLALASAIALIWRHPLADLAGKAAAPIGAGFTVIALATGSLWGKPTWGTWWVWDARLTSVVVLLFLYLPIIKFSVDWWNTLHQPASISRIGTPAIDPAMLTPLLLMGVAYLGLFIMLLLLRMRVELAQRRVLALQLARSRAGDPA